MRKGLSFAEYLALHRFRIVQFFIWAAALALVLIGGEQLLVWQGDKSGEEFMLDLLKSGKSLGPLVVALTLGASLGEELLFRGFMFRGMAESRAGWGLAILVPNVFWVLMHVQYAWPTLTVLFAMGIVLGLARHYSGSVVLPIVLHFLSNAISTFMALSMEK